MQVRQSPDHRDRVDQDQADGEVHGGARGQHGGALPRLLLVHRVGLVLGRDFVDRGHARDVAEAAQRDGLDAVLGLAQLVGPAGGPQRRAEADEVATHLHPGGARHPHVAAFVQCHRQQDAQRERDDAEHEHHLVSSPFPEISRSTARFARSRAQRCASSTSSTVAGSAAHWSAARSTSAIVRTMRRESDAPVKERRRRFLVRCVVDRGQAATALSGVPGEVDGREDVRVQRLELPGRGGAEVTRAARRRAPGPASPAPARSAASCPAGWPAPASSRR